MPVTGGSRCIDRAHTIYASDQPTQGCGAMDGTQLAPSPRYELLLPVSVLFRASDSRAWAAGCPSAALVASFFPGLRSLSSRGTVSDNDVINHLGALTELKTLELSYCYRISDIGIGKVDGT